VTEELERDLEQAVIASRVLVVEDDSVNRAVIKAMLASGGFKNVAFAENGIAGLEAIEAEPPELVLLDLRMPGMGGEEMLIRLRALPMGQDLPVIVQTANDSPSTRTALFHAGAVDFVAKPLTVTELLARVRVHLRNRLLVRSLERALRRIEGELATARRTQRDLLPPADMLAEIEKRHGLSLAAHFAPCSELGGDLWGCKAIGEEVLFYLFDIAGHGVSAALNAFRVRAMLDGLNAPDMASDPAGLLARINAKCYEALPRGHFATMTAVGFDGRNRIATVASAGAPGVIHGDRTAGAVTVLDGRGVPLGIRPNSAYVNHTLPLEAGSFLFIYSDGLSESRGGDGSLVTEGGIAALVETLRDRPDPLAALIAALGDGAFDAADDRTALWVGVKERP
jgi:sigma-B regulation protein RsbU (phosphoserine phosphatase)